jgi:hypothetical protein
MTEVVINMLLTGHVYCLCKGSPEMRNLKNAVKVKDAVISREQYTYWAAQRCNFYDPQIQHLKSELHNNMIEHSVL